MNISIGNFRVTAELNGVSLFPYSCRLHTIPYEGQLLYSLFEMIRQRNQFVQHFFMIFGGSGIFTDNWFTCNTLGIASN